MDKLTQTAAPADLPVTLAELKLHARLPAAATEDAWLTACLTAATHSVEKYLEASLVSRTYKLLTHEFPPPGCGLRLPYPPVESITSIKYLDGDGVQQTLDPSLYRLIVSDERAEVWPAIDEEWPYARLDPAAVEIIYVAGFGDAADVPEGIKLGIMVQAAEMYEHREWQITGIPVTGVNVVVQNVLSQFRNLDTI